MREIEEDWDYIKKIDQQACDQDYNYCTCIQRN